MIPEHDEVKDHDPTPRASHEPFRFTPSLLDPNSFAFASFANQPPGYYTPTPGGTNTLYHSQAGDLHTPSMGISIGTPLSLPTSEGAVSLGSVLDMHHFSQSTLQSALHVPHLQSFSPFGAQTSFAPSQFQTQPAAFEPMDASATVSPVGVAHGGGDTEMHGQSPPSLLFPSAFDAAMAAPPVPSSEKYASASAFFSENRG